MRSRRGSDEWQFTAHPAFGLKLTGPGEPRMPRPTQLGLAWLRLSRAEQARRRQAFFSALLAPWSERTTFHARGLDEEATRRLTALEGAEAGEGAPAVVSGPLTAQTLDALLRSDLRALVVRRDGRPLLATRWGWLAATVHLTDAEEQSTRERLGEAREEQERAAAARRAAAAGERATRAESALGADRRGRAIAYLAVYYVMLALAVLVGWLALRQLGDAFPTALAIALGIAVAVTFFSLLTPVQRLVTQWYGPG
jgi:hypothetical protein